MSLYTKTIDLQKLGMAWKKVYGNKPTAGADSVTCEMFNANSRQELMQLNIELKEHRYHVFPVKTVALVKENKVREVSLYTMRDKIVQTSLAQELSNIYEPLFPECACAYRNARSALQAIDSIERNVKGEKYHYALKTDIHKFFDCIDLTKLRAFLSKKIRETDVLDLVFDILKTPGIGPEGELIEKRTGVYQGSAISPVLSNVYLMEFDRMIQSEEGYFIRYADDMLFLTETIEQAENRQRKTELLLDELGLELNKDKTCIRRIEDGFEFLGYGFNRSGKVITQKAKDKLETALEDVWLTTDNSSIKDKLLKGSQIINGWEQYFKGGREIQSIFEYAVLVYMVRNKAEIHALAGQRERHRNNSKEIAGYLAGIWRELGQEDLYRFEYEQYFELSDKIRRIESEPLPKEITELLEKLFMDETEDDWTSLMQAYADAAAYDISEKAGIRLEGFRNRQKKTPCIKVSAEDIKPVFEDNAAELVYELLVGREDMYTRETLTETGRRKSEFVPEPLTQEVLKRHLTGLDTIGTYPVRNNNTVHYVVYDVDVSRKCLLMGEGNNLTDHLKNAAAAAATLKQELQMMGFTAYIEFSGYRGYHVWLFFMEWIPVKYVYVLNDILAERTKGQFTDDISFEAFPARNRKNKGSCGQTIKLPYGIHLLSGKRSYFCTDEFDPIENMAENMRTVAKYTLENVKRVIGSQIPDTRDTSADRVQKEIVLDYSKLPVMNNSIKLVLEKCALMRYLVNKAMSSGYLTHFERQSVLYVFGHIGDEGKEFVHTVMRFTLNYQYLVTQKFINRIPEKPISCIKLREQYKQITAECGCNCVFRKMKKCYPSPVLHALIENTDGNQTITIPASRLLTESSKEKVYEELSAHTELQGLAEKLVELSKQKRGIDKALKKIEEQLNAVFDNADTDCMEVDIGMLTRRRKECGYEWMIEM